MMLVHLERVCLLLGGIVDEQRVHRRGMGSVFVINDGFNLEDAAFSVLMAQERGRDRELLLLR